MNPNQKTIKINPKDISKISPELILNITLKNGFIVILDDSIPSQEINKLLYNYNNDDKFHSNNRNNDIRSINLEINNSYTKDNINGKTLEINDSYIFNQNHMFNKEILNNSNNNTKNNFYYSNPNNSINQNQLETKTKNFKTQSQSISDLVTEKLQKKFHNSLKNSGKKRAVNTTINSEININIKGNGGSKNKYSNNILKDFDELLLIFNDKKKGLNNKDISNNSKKKYKFYKTMNSKKNKLFLDDLSGISPNTKAIKYIRNDQNNNDTIITDLNRNSITNNNSRLSFLKEKALKRNKSNNFYLLKTKKIISDIISPPNNLPYNKISLMQK